MNERIRELYIKTLSEECSNPALVDIEKFAELIVRECLSIVEPTEDSNDEWCVTLKGTAQEIKQHFGVEE